MSDSHRPKPVTVRHTATRKQAERSGSFYPKMGQMPAVPPVDWSAVDAEAPEPQKIKPDTLPEADAVVITWAEAEWAALEHVFLESDRPLAYYERSNSHWPGWEKYDKDMPYYRGQDYEDWNYWGYYQLVEVGSRKVLLFKSNTHLDWPGKRYLEDLIRRLAKTVKPKLILSIGTAGGARTEDHVGAVNVVNSGTLYDAHTPPDRWPNYRSSYKPDWSTVEKCGFEKLVFPVPADKDRLELLTQEFNSYYGTQYKLSDLDPEGLNLATDEPAVSNLVPYRVPLLTTSTFVVGTDDGKFQDFACIEMDDAVIGKVCKEEKVGFGFVRNISDPVQSAQLPTETQGDWGSAVYDVFGMYTSYNGAVVAWAMLNAG